MVSVESQFGSEVGLLIDDEVSRHYSDTVPLYLLNSSRQFQLFISVIDAYELFYCFDHRMVT